MELKEGMHVRTKYGVAKILSTNYTDDIVEDFLIVDKELEFGLIGGCDWSLCDKKDVIKASHDIIDLIEVGDYVNGYKVDFVQDNWVVFNHNHPSQLNILAKDIKSIVTKEQFESMSYKVGKYKN